MEYGCTEFLQFVVDVDLGGDLNVLVAEDLLNRVDVHTVPAQAGAVGMTHLVRGEHRNVRVTLVHASHKLLEPLRKVVGILQTAGLRGKKVQTVVRQRLHQGDTLVRDRNGAKAVFLRRGQLEHADLGNDRALNVQRAVARFEHEVRPHGPQQLAAAHTGIEQECSSGKRLECFLAHNGDLLFGQHTLDALVRRAAELHALCRILVTQVVLDSRFKDVYQAQPDLLQMRCRQTLVHGGERLYIDWPHIGQIDTAEVRLQIQPHDLLIGLERIGADKRLLVGLEPLARPLGEVVAFPDKGFAGTRGYLGGYAKLLGFLFRIGKADRTVKGLAQRLAVNVAPECQLVLVAVVLAGWLFS